MIKRRIRSKASGMLVSLLIVAVCVGSVFPLFWMVLVSLKNGMQTIDPSVWIFKPTLDNYKETFLYRNTADFLKNSAIVVVCTTVLSIILGGMAAYGLARFKFKSQENVAFGILSLRMLPAIAIVIPLFVMAQMLKVLDTHIVLIICYMLFNIPFSIWMLRGFFEELPFEIEEAACIDGCTRFQVLMRIVMPLAAPGLVATAIFCVINSWNEFTFAVFLTSANASTLPTSVTLFLSASGVAWGQMASVGVVTIFPVLVFAMIVQKYMIRGLSFGGVK